jgi:hypothetical protein
MAAASAEEDLLLALHRQPLYVPLKLQSDDPNSEIRALRLFTGKLDLYCPACKKESTFSVLRSTEAEKAARETQVEAAVSPGSRGSLRSRRFIWGGQFWLGMVCARDAAHNIEYHVASLPLGDDKPEALQKYGQLPSMADIAMGDFARYSVVLDAAHIREYRQAAITGAHGYAVAACVYLRRVFDGVLASTRDDVMAVRGMAEWQEYSEADTLGRIRLLGDALPSFLTEVPEVFRLLSHGLHELTEEEAAQELPMLDNAIQIILRQRVEAKERQQLSEETAKFIRQATNRHFNKDKESGDGRPRN